MSGGSPENIVEQQADARFNRELRVTVDLTLSDQAMAQYIQASLEKAMVDFPSSIAARTSKEQVNGIKIAITFPALDVGVEVNKTKQKIALFYLGNASVPVGKRERAFEAVQAFFQTRKFDEVPFWSNI